MARRIPEAADLSLHASTAVTNAVLPCYPPKGTNQRFTIVWCASAQRPVKFWRKLDLAGSEVKDVRRYAESRESA